MPQCAIAHVESAASTWLNAWIDAPNSKECSSATARSNCGATLELHEVAKWTVPSVSPGAPAGCACCWENATDAGRVKATAARNRCFICAPLDVRYLALHSAVAGRGLPWLPKGARARGWATEPGRP